MHLLMIILAVAIASILRASWKPSTGDWQQRYSSSLLVLLFPTVLIFATVIALICMGWQGRMGNWQTGSIGYILAVTTILVFLLLLVKLAYQGLNLSQWAKACQPGQIDNHPIAILDSDALFAGQVGFWQPELILSRGLLQILTPDQLQAVIAHEQGHLYYRDTFWFFWLGWVRTCTCWLPNTENLWQELLILRELRADAFAAAQVDPLLLAESLLIVVSGAQSNNDVFCAGLDSSNQCDRLEQRINALLSTPTQIPNSPIKYWHFFILALLPLVTVLFHQ